MPLQRRAGHIALLLPLCTSSVSVGLSLFQWPVFGSFLTAGKNDESERIAGKPFSYFWDAFLPTSLPIIVLPCLTSAAAGLYASRWIKTYYTTPSSTSRPSRWYTAGAILAASHLLFAPLVAGPIKRIVESGEHVEAEEAEKSNRKEMDTWFMWHTLRTLVVDIPALACFAKGAAQVLEVLI